MLTVRALTSQLGLEIAAGADAAAEREIRWAHISEIADPTPWLSGGELLLTTGIQLGGAERQRALIRLLAEKKLAGLGFGTGFDHRRIPATLVKEAEKLDFPVFEVPYEKPFIAITEAVARSVVNENYDVLARGLEVNERLERLVLSGGGLAEIARELAGAVGGSAAVLDSRGELIAHGGRKPSADLLDAVRAQVRERGTTAPFVPAEEGAGSRALAHPVSPRAGAPEAWLLVLRRSGPLGNFERLCVQQAAVVVALELMRERVARETERRLSGEVLSAALSGRLPAAELRDRLAPFGIGDSAAALVFQLDDPTAAQVDLERQLADDGHGGLVAVQSAGRRQYLCAVIDGDGADPLETAAATRRRLERAHGPTRAAASRAAPSDRVRHSFHEARCALEATALTNGAAPEVASHRDLGAFTLLLSVQDPDALRLYCENVLGPIEEADGRYAGELLRSLEAYIDRNGHWERAASDCYCHRHTLRYRIKRIEELTGRDLGRANDRVEMWLALRAKELIA